MGAVALAALAAAFWREGPDGRRTLRIFVVMLAALAVFGVAGDFLHALIDYSASATHRLLHRLVGMVEDGGELVMASAILVLASRKLEHERTTIARRAPNRGRVDGYSTIVMAMPTAAYQSAAARISSSVISAATADMISCVRLPVRNAFNCVSM